ncbi:MAG: hypothetical protein ACI3ZF_06005 [Candidatus Cryptobacteroides sp.]
MIFILIYLSGWIADMFLFKEIFARKELNFWKKLLLVLLILLFSWIGYFCYKLVIKYFLDRELKKKTQ